MNERTRQAKKMLDDGLHPSQINTETFGVPSQTVRDKSHLVSKTGKGLVCECDDHQKRRVVFGKSVWISGPASHKRDLHRDKIGNTDCFEGSLFLNYYQSLQMGVPFGRCPMN